MTQASSSTSGWDWSADRPAWHETGSSRWFRPFVASAPWITVGILLLMLYMAGNALTAASGVLFDLPEGEAGEGARTSLVALVMPTKRETLVFFDDARYVFGDSLSRSVFSSQLAELAAKRGEKTMLVLADRRTDAGVLMALASDARRAGIARILFAEKNTSQQQNEDE